MTPPNDNNRRARPAVQKVAIDVFEAALTGMIVYLIMRPGALTEAADYARSAYRAVTHEMSVWQARREIRNLPETP